MAELTGEVDARELAAGLTLRVRLRGVRAFAFRLWLGRKLILLAAWVIGCGIEVDD